MIFCAPLPLKFTVLGADEVTFNVPEVIVITPAIPSVAADDNCSDVPLIVVLNRLAVPPKVEVPVKVAVPADAEKLPPTVSAKAIEKSAAVVTEPLIDRPPKLLIPAPDRVFDAPVMVIVPELPIRLPPTTRLPATLNEVAVLTEPATVRLASEIPEPLTLAAEPVISNVLPVTWLNDPDPVVARLPVKDMLVEVKLTPEAATVRLLKFWVPVPLTVFPEPEKVTVPVPPLKIPLLVQLPPIECEKLAPSKLVEAAMETFPLTEIFDAALNNTEVPVPNVRVRLPITANGVTEEVFTAVPLELLSFRLP